MCQAHPIRLSRYKLRCQTPHLHGLEDPAMLGQRRSRPANLRVGHHDGPGAQP